MIPDKILPHAIFFQQFLSQPGMTGSICPSGRPLAKTLVREAMRSHGNGLIIDLGAGSGPISRELLAFGIEPQNILAIDLTDRFAQIFHRECPGVALCIADARQLGKIIASKFPHMRVRAIISSLPLRVMPDKIIAAIINEALDLLDDDGVYVQYTYAFWMLSALNRYGLCARKRAFVPLNLPPALVETYQPHHH